MDEIDPFRTESAFERETPEQAVNTELPGSPEPQQQEESTSSPGQQATLSADQARRMNPQPQPFRLRDGDRDPKVFVRALGVPKSVKRSSGG